MDKKSYTVTIDGNIVFLQTESGDSLQLSLWEYNTLMSYPLKSVKEIAELFYEKEKSLGRAEIEKRISIAFKILGR